ncbi:hypothetical protein JNJ66_00780 [Candidatus Saccharibacteria bacterium]|nr:hypothetical protein [Candidatus Saccharibacteria bacterium]
MRKNIWNIKVISGVLSLLAAPLVFSGAVSAATTSVNCSDLPAAVAAASPGDTLNVTGDCAIASTINVDKQLTIKGDGSATISTSGSGYLFNVTAPGTVIDNLNIVKTDKANQNIIGVLANDVTISNNDFSGQYTIAANDHVSRALEVGGSLTGLNLTGNTFNNLRQPAYINNATSGQINNNYVNETRGFVIVSDTNLTFDGNTFGTNVLDIVFISQNNSANNYPCEVVRQISKNNDNAVVQNQTQTTPCPTFPDSKDACKNGGWKTFTGVAFKNQGDCVSYVANGKAN